jgi:hypothetical protein
VQPTSADPVTRRGVYVHRFFRTREQHVQEIVDLSVEAWKTFATDDRYGTEQIAFFRPRGRTSDENTRTTAGEPAAERGGAREGGEGGGAGEVLARPAEMLLISWYPDLANWETSRQFPPEALALFRTRAERVDSMLPFAMRLLT